MRYCLGVESNIFLVCDLVGFKFHKAHGTFLDSKAMRVNVSCLYFNKRN